MDEQTDVIFTETEGNNGSLGFITLNRPQALNSLNTAMILAIFKQLQHWVTDHTIKAVVIKSASEKAFCAGGDIRQIYAARANKNHTIAEFFWHEYRLNTLIKYYPKPYIALLNGITMGGGVGISAHGTYRIATEKLSFAMPETGIGFFPDVGGSYLLAHCPGELGTYLGLTGTRINAEDALYCDLVDHTMTSEKLSAFVNALAAENFSGNVDHVINNALQPLISNPTHAPLDEHRKDIDHCFKFDSVEEIIRELEKQQTTWCNNTVEVLLKKSPTSLRVTLQALRKGKRSTFTECMQMEYRMTNHFLQKHDFYEGIRAAIIDKDQKPQWDPKELQNVTKQDVEHYFAPLLPQEELHFNEHYKEGPQHHEVGLQEDSH